MYINLVIWTRKMDISKIKHVRKLVSVFLQFRNETLETKSTATKLTQKIYLLCLSHNYKNSKTIQFIILFSVLISPETRLYVCVE